MPLIPIDWLASHVDVLPGTDPAQLAAALVKVGLEEEEIHPGQITGPLVVGKVLTREAKKQSNGKTINYCRVDVGQHNDAPGTGKEPADFPSRGIICGAHNFDVDDYVVVSLPGAVLPGGFEISARKTYGHLSDGMICSARELELGDDHSGIIVLAHGDAQAREKGLPAVGESVLDYLGVPGEVLEINITPDRGYCFAMRGVAREYAHSTGRKFTDPALCGKAAESVPESNNAGFPVTVRDSAPIHGNVGCDRFVTRIVRGVDPAAESPKWLRKRLLAAGMRPISLAVDATNYVMLDLGQPLHAYDLAKLNAPFVVRRATVGEHLTTLDGTDRNLDGQDLLISDSPEGVQGARPIALAGVMGGGDTEIDAQTTDILVEAAHFDPVSVARTSRRHRIPSEAAKRFERGVDWQLAPVAAQAVVDLLVEYGGGTAAGENFEINTAHPFPSFEFKTSETQRLTGLAVSAEKQKDRLEEIGCTVKTADTGAREVFTVTPPSWRPDLVGPAHLVEEIARLEGYDRIPSVVPNAPAGRGLSAVQRRRRDIARTMADSGWVQVLSYPFVGAGVFDRQEIGEGDSRRTALKLKNPLQEEAPYLRTSLLDTLLETARMNVARGNAHVAIFEISTVTSPEGIVSVSAPGVGKRPNPEELDALRRAVPRQPIHLAAVAAPRVADGGLDFAPLDWDWRDAVQAAKDAAAVIGVNVTVCNAQRAPFHPGRCAQIMAGDTVLGYAGELAPKVCDAFELPKRSIACELDLDLLDRVRGEDPIQVDSVTTFPVTKEDIALVVDEDVCVADVAGVISSVAGELLESVCLFDVYRGDQIPEGKKSLAFALRLRGRDHTLTQEEAANVRKRIVKRSHKVCGAQLRG
ncbi:phenylalanine--tRNA ligase subunit beta [Arcanobacterium sp. S3PF19]|uniref:phenylalanine--tRNA ligase subunit beta n=1 Tax=Arcanobacterium sp. S3PF19 TaxID=1219585 RepID=UPI00050DE9FE|nr:phenylalanine--tRNA ligase subunit beta [Arcanobacterium sp. S3PF19]KGF06525.1 phenylalanyl-tRNA synthetase subunit beta [Arcanobacterium sp. S3PF19]